MMGEPSVSNGIAYHQLASSHLFIHRVPAKLSNRVMPYGTPSAGYSSSWCPPVFLTCCLFHEGTDIPWTHHPASFSWSLY